MSGVSLYHMADDVTAALDAIQQAETPEESEVLALQHQATFEAIVRKVDSFNGYVTAAESRIAMLAAEEKRLADARRNLQNKVDRLNAYAIAILQKNNWEKLEGDTSAIGLKKNPPAVVIDNAEVIPPRFVTIRQETNIDKNALKAALKCGEIPGAHLEQKIALKRS